MGLMSCCSACGSNWRVNVDCVRKKNGDLIAWERRVIVAYLKSGYFGLSQPIQDVAAYVDAELAQAEREIRRG